MTPKEQKGLTQAIQANRRTLSLLDKRIDDLIKTHPSLLNDYDVDDKQPFFYGAVGVDGEAGIPITTANVGENPAFGYVRMHPDSAFVLSRITSAVTFAPLLTPTLTTTRYARGLGFRFYDESSSRWVTFTNQNNAPQQKAILPSEAFTPYDSLNDGGFMLSAECVFPRSAVIRVEAYVQDFPVQAQRLQVVFGGYKVFGG